MNFLKEFFDFTRPNDNVLSGQCKICENSYSDNIGSTGNFHKHLKRKHNDKYERAKCPDPTEPEIDSNESAENLSDQTKKINNAILEELIVKCNLPPATVEYTAFRKFVKTIAPRWKHTSSKYFTNALLPSLVQNIQDKIKTTLKDINHLSITVDVWNDRKGRSFIGVTGHCLDLDWIPQAFLLDFRRLKGPHTGDNILNITEEILESLKVSSASHLSINLQHFQNSVRMLFQFDDVNLIVS